MEKKIRLPKPSKKIEEAVQKELEKLFKEKLYLPLVDELDLKEDEVLKNSDKKSPLTKYIKTGRIYFYRGQFKGKFNAVISRELRRLGAKYNRKQGSYDILSSRLPDDLLSAINVSENKFKKSMERIAKKLEKISAKKLVKELDLTNIIDKQIFDTNKDFEKQTKAIGVEIKMTDKERAKISKEYNNNMKLYIKEWAEDEIKNLRDVMTKNVNAGIRYEEIAKDIQKRYKVSKSKAQFLARQETNLLTAQMSEQNAKKAGATHYIWRTVVGSPKSPVRPAHKALNGKKIAYDKPPIVSPDGRRAHAGEDYLCRCFQEAIIEF